MHATGNSGSSPFALIHNNNKKKIIFSCFSECCKFQHTFLQHEQNILFSSGKGAWYNNSEKCQGGSKCHTRGMEITISLWSVKLIEIDPNV